MSYNGKWDLSPNALFCMIFRLFKRFPPLSYRKKPPLSSAFNPHEHELLAQSQPGERPAAAGGSRPARQNQTTRPRGRREETDEVPNQKPNGLWPPPCQPGFWRSFSRGNGLPRQAVPPAEAAPKARLTRRRPKSVWLLIRHFIGFLSPASWPGRLILPGGTAPPCRGRPFPRLGLCQKLMFVWIKST